MSEIVNIKWEEHRSFKYIDVNKYDRKTILDLVNERERLILEHGSHDGLIGMGGVYNEFWTAQSMIRWRIVGVRQNGFLFYSLATLYFLIW